MQFSIFTITVIFLSALFILALYTRVNNFSKGTRTPDIFKKYVYEYVPTMMEDHDAIVSDYYIKPQEIPISKKITNESYGERKCRDILEKLFQKPFQRLRPSFLNNDVTSQNLELDCYNPELKLACEYQGEAHYKFIPHFHKNADAFKNQQYRDYMKKVKCREHGVKLIEVPYNVTDIEQHIINELKK